MWTVIIGWETRGKTLRIRDGLCGILYSRKGKLKCSDIHRLECIDNSCVIIKVHRLIWLLELFKIIVTVKEAVNLIKHEGKTCKLLSMESRAEKAQAEVIFCGGWWHQWF